MLNQLSVKLIGIVNMTLTGWPRCFPGLYLGKDFTTLSASASKFLSTPLTILTLVTAPHLSTIKLT